MPIVVDISFRTAGALHAFDPAGLELREGDYVIAETDHGIEFGQVLVEPREVPEGELGGPLQPIVRKAGDDDFRQAEENRVKEREAFRVGQHKIERHGLPMKLIDVEYTFDRRRITFHFSAEGRVDFRNLVRDLAGHFRARIELHQVGVRDEAKMIGGLGPCGRPLCCSTFLLHFEPVTIRMAKEQGLSLNPLKISGLCGRLMCCLNYENQFYREAKNDMPKLGSQVATERGEGKVVELRVPKGTCVAALPEGGFVEVPCGKGCCARAAASAPPAEVRSRPEPAPRRPEPKPAARTEPPPPREGEQPRQPGHSPRRRRRPRGQAGGKQPGAQ